MRVTEIEALFAYNAWATGRILAAAADLPAKDFAAPTREAGGRLRGCLLHLTNALRFHRAGWQAHLAPAALPDNMAAFARLWVRQEAALRAFLAALTDADLDRPLARLRGCGVPHDRAPVAAAGPPRQSRHPAPQRRRPDAHRSRSLVP